MEAGAVKASAVDVIEGPRRMPMSWAKIRGAGDMVDAAAAAKPLPQVQQLSKIAKLLG